eukprot:3710289-Rhodomonas_salina.1
MREGRREGGRERDLSMASARSCSRTPCSAEEGRKSKGGGWQEEMERGKNREGEGVREMRDAEIEVCSLTAYAQHHPRTRPTIHDSNPQSRTHKPTLLRTHQPPNPSDPENLETTKVRTQPSASKTLGSSGSAR